MSGTNHITGGIVFTGIFASFWNINIFSRPEMLAATGFFAILPDVDHLKSPIGKAFYPLAKWLDRRYGHRTITHSLAVYIPGIFLVMFLERLLGTGFSYTLVFAFAYFSHLLFDMLTKQGVPLFYPFKRNPCVIPGNPEMRLRSSDLKTEAACFAIFILLGITCQNLFANGFWNTYNSQFTDLKHLHQEAQQSPTMLSVQYHFTSTGNRVHQGDGLLISSSDKEAVIYNSKTFVTITANDRLHNIEPTRTSMVLSTQEVFFSNISPDSLAKLFQGKAIVSLTVQSNSDFSYIKDNKPETGKRAELSYTINPQFVFTSPKSAIADTTDITGRRRILLYELTKENERTSALRTDKSRITTAIQKLQNDIPAMELYEREKATKELQKLRTELASYPNIQDNAGKLRIQLQELKAKPTAEPEPVLVSGYINYLKV